MSASRNPTRRFGAPPIIHRDLKSLNLLVADDGKIKVCDFGLVRTKHTNAGTPAYMAPELLHSRAFNKSVDVYAFGVLLWEMLALEIPYSGWDVLEIKKASDTADFARYLLQIPAPRPPWPSASCV